MRAFWGGKGGFVIEFGGVCYQDTYHDVSCVYSTSILQDTRILMYLDVYSVTSRKRIRYISGYISSSGYMYLHGLFITIHQDTPRYKITIHVSWTRLDDTSRYNQDTIRIHAGSMRDPCGIQRSMRDTCICRGSRIHKGYMRDTSKIHKGIHVSQILKFIQGLEIHPGRK